MKWLGVGLAATFLFGCGEGLGARTEISPSDEAIHYQGRFEWLSEEGPQYAQPGSTIRVAFTGTSLRVRLREFSGGVDEYGDVRRNQYDVLIDGERQLLEPEPGVSVHVLAENLPEGTHSLTMFKRTDVWIGEGQLLGFELDPDASLVSVSRPDRRLEFVGDAVTVGLGVNGPGSDCDYSARFQNHASAFPTLVAQSLRAEQTTVAASGIGVVVNYDGTTDTTMPRIYDRALLARSGSKWSFDWKPHAVVVNLGTSDFTRNGDPGREAFIAEYSSLLAQIRSQYPDAFILAATGPTLTDGFPTGVSSATLAREYAEASVAQRKAAGDTRIDLVNLGVDDGARGYGCDFHPSAETHRLIAEKLSEELKSRLGW